MQIIYRFVTKDATTAEIVTTYSERGSEETNSPQSGESETASSSSLSSSQSDSSSIFSAGKEENLIHVDVSEALKSGDLSAFRETAFGEGEKQRVVGGVLLAPHFSQVLVHEALRCLFTFFGFL